MADYGKWDDPARWARLGSRWGTEAVIQMARRLAERRPITPTVIVDYVAQTRSGAPMPPRNPTPIRPPASSRCSTCGASVGPMTGPDKSFLYTVCRCGNTLVANTRGIGERVV